MNSNILFISVAIVCLGISFLYGAAGYIFGILVIAVTLWANKWKWSIIGFKKTKFLPALLIAAILAIGIYLLVDILIQPIVEIYFGEIDLSNFDGIRGNFTNYALMIGIMWIAAAFGEEIFYRGYLMKRIAEILGNKNESWYIAALINGAFFGLAHLYQGMSGVITTGIIGFIFGIIFMRKRNLLIPILVHGLYDMIGITLIYLEKERIILDLINL